MRVADGFALSGNQLRATVDHIVRWDPAHVLAEVDSKRRIIDWCEAVETEFTRAGLGDRTDVTHMVFARWLALPYGDRPGFDPQWALAAVA